MYEKLFAKAGLSLDRLRSFRQIVQAGGISNAANGDPNRQSQFSRQLRELEVYFGTELVRRGRGPLRLTASGAELNRLTGRFLGALEEYVLHCASAPVPLIVGAGESLIQWWLVPKLSLQESNSTGESSPIFSFENLRNAEIIDRVLDGSIDLGCVTRDVSDKRLRAEPIGRLEYGLFVPKALMPAAGFGRQNPVLKHLPLAQLIGGTGVAEALQSEAQRTRCELNVRLQLSSYPQLATAVRLGKAAAVMPTLAAESLSGAEVVLLQPPFLRRLARRPALLWNPAIAEVRPAIRTGLTLLRQALPLPTPTKP